MISRKIFIKLANFLLCVFYMLGAVVVLFPNQETVVPHEFGYLAVGILLLATGVFGSGYFLESEEE
jgi:hypothetical protein